MRGAAASGAVNIKVGACDIEAMSPPMVPMARGGVINPPLRTGGSAEIIAGGYVEIHRCRAEVHPPSATPARC